MIVSGFTQKKGFPEDTAGEIDGQHSHCISCCKAACTKFADQVTSCEMVTCGLCGWRCHRCKQVEHVLACPEEKVSCVNKEYGCPHLIKRSRMSVHLPVCPASVVCCSEEWSRWPMYAREKGERLPLPPSKTYIDCGQLDVGLAMRDQRMLIDSLRAPKKLRRVLRNALTQKYPAAPFTPHSRSHETDVAASSDTSHTVSDDESDAPWDLTKSPPGLRESIRSKLFLVPKETTDKMAETLGASAKVLSSSQDRLPDSLSIEGDSDHHTQPSGANFRSSSLPPDHTFSGNSSKDASLNCVSDINTHNASHIQCETLASAEKDQPALLSNTSMCQNLELSDNSCSGEVHECGANQESARSAERALLPPQQKEAGAASLQSLERSLRSSVSSDRVSESSSRSRSTLQDMGGTQLHKLLGGEGGDDNGDKDQDGSAPGEIFLHKLLGVNVGIECINKCVSKSPSMYTFICAQNFRRDEFNWHFKNVHQDIHQGCQGWIEQRCPLAYLGCTFSFTRLEPAQPGAQVYHSWLQESFGLRSTAYNNTFSNNGCCPAQNVSKDSLPSQSRPGGDSGDIQKQSDCDVGAPLNGQSKPLVKDDGEAEKADTKHTSSGPSLSDLSIYDRDFDWLPATNVVGGHGGRQAEDDSQLVDPLEKSVNGKNDCMDKVDSDNTAESSLKSQLKETVASPKLRMSVRPTIYTAMNWDSKVLFEYEVEEDEESKGTNDQLHLLDLPIEVLETIAKHLDSFTLCNLALTCHVLRDVCCGLLDEHGIVVLNWERHKSDCDITWRVTNKRWMFSTSFEPIKSWRFKQNVPHMGDHLKVCPFNKDILRHTERIQVMKPLENMA